MVKIFPFYHNEANFYHFTEISVNVDIIIIIIIIIVIIIIIIIITINHIVNLVF